MPGNDLHMPAFAGGYGDRGCFFRFFVAAAHGAVKPGAIQQIVGGGFRRFGYVKIRNHVQGAFSRPHKIAG